MKKTIILSFISLLSVLALTSCKVEVVGKDNSPVTTSNVTVDKFTDIHVIYPADVTFIPSDTFSVKVVATEKARENFSINVKRNVLEIKENKKQRHIIFNAHDESIKVTVKAPTLKNVIIIGSGSLKCDSTIKAKSLTLNVTGTGGIDIKDIQANDVSANIAGTGSINAGLTRVANTNMSMSGTGNINIDFSQCGNATASLAGTGYIELTGDVKSFTQNVSGTGSIKTRKLKVGKQ